MCVGITSQATNIPITSIIKLRMIMMTMMGIPMATMTMTMIMLMKIMETILMMIG